MYFFFFFFNDTATTEIYTLSLHDALPICGYRYRNRREPGPRGRHIRWRSEEHTSELQSLRHLVCRLLLEKKKKNEHNIRYMGKIRYEQNNRLQTVGTLRNSHLKPVSTTTV